MKKKVLFLLTIICLFMISNKVNAETVQFYEAEKLTGIYTKSVSQESTHFQRSRFFRRKSDNKPAYCIEPFRFFEESNNYGVSTVPNNIDSQTWRNMSLIAYYGYGYKNHTEEKWYAITQLLIWQEAEKQNSFYFTDVLNGEKIDAFTAEIQEIKNLVSEHNKLPSMRNTELTIKKGTDYVYDVNDAIKNFKNTDNLVSIIGNKIDVSNLDEGSYTLTFERLYENSDEPVLFYYSDESQNLMTRGYPENDKFTLTINVYDAQIKVKKIDKDNNTSVSSGSAKLCDAKFDLLDSNKQFIKEFSLDQNCEVVINNLDLGKYYIKEKEAGKGYILDTNTYEINLTKDDSKINFQISNKVIDKEIIIHKKFGTDESNSVESNVDFEIYSNDLLIDSITTDDKGQASIRLPYGEYVFKQKTSTYGYTPVADFKVIVDDKSDNSLSYDLMDYLIKKKVKIHKNFGTDDDKKPESNVRFDIYSNDSFIDSVVTDDRGDATIELPYGEYVFKQITTVDGYSLVDDFKVIVDDKSNNSLSYDLMDYLIEVPDTRSDKDSSYLYILLFLDLAGLLYVKKINNY